MLSFIKKIVFKLKNLFANNNSAIITKYYIKPVRITENYGFAENGMDIAEKDIYFYEDELKKIYSQLRIWSLNVKYDQKIYASRRALEATLVMIMMHSYGTEFLNNPEERSLCNYINVIYKNKILGWSEYRFREIIKVKGYMNDIVHPFQGSFDDKMNLMVKNSTYQLLSEFKKALGIIKKADRDKSISSEQCKLAA